MKSTLVLIGLLALFTTFVSASSSASPFEITSLTAYEPNGNPDGDVDFYHFNFTVSSGNGDTDAKTTTFCTKTWSDNAWTQPQAYSVNVPTGEWMACADPAFSFQLYPYFAIGNFTLGVQQNTSDSVTTPQTLLSGAAHITNTTLSHPPLNCTIDPVSVQYVQHASGTCALASTHTISIPATVTSTVPPCPASSSVNTTFIVQAQTSPGQGVLLSGSVPELGGWDTAQAVRLSSADNDGSEAWVTWSGSVELQGGEQVQYKYLLDDGSGELQWECCENRVYQVPAQGYCKEVVAGNDPDMFRS